MEFGFHSRYNRGNFFVFGATADCKSGDGIALIKAGVFVRPFDVGGYGAGEDGLGGEVDREAISSAATEWEEGGESAGSCEMC